MDLAELRVAVARSRRHPPPEHAVLVPVAEEMLQRARKKTCLKPAEVEANLRWYPGKVSRVESGTRVPVPAEVDRLADLYHLGKRDRETLHVLADAARKRESPARVADFGQTYITLERAAAEIRYFDTELIFGLMQTEDYARAVMAKVSDTVGRGTVA
jgi:hypothetical protein